MDIASLTIDRVREGVLAREFSAVELAAEALRFAESENPKTNAYLRLSPERAMAAARRVDPTGFLDGEIRGLTAADPVHCNESAIAAAFGTPKPTLAHSQAPQLLNLRTFPTLMGYSSRILAESWESTNLFFAALADELMMPAAQLNVVIPDWTRRSVEQIFATHLEDWPALLRAMRFTADQARAQNRKLMAAESRRGTEDRPQ